MRLVIDRFEGEYAIVVDDNENTYNVDRKLFEENKEGDVVYLAYSMIQEKKDTNEAEDLVNKLFED